MTRVFDRRKLRNLRVERELSPDDVAKKAGIKTEAYEAYEAGKDKPSVWWAQRIAFALECTPNDFTRVQPSE